MTDIIGAASVLREILATLQERLEAMETRLTALEKRPIGAIDCGVWISGRSYPTGAGTTFDGGYWIAQFETTEQPGEGNASWRLAVRRGRQGREGKQGPPGRDAIAERPKTNDPNSGSFSPASFTDEARR